ncbi:N-glycosyltransferase [Roseovarius albus]|uniref:N-glycosyltransferase n=1 Tax=Roseovarius albus TaxID=1247867 RepID=A0A1X6ZLC2_9RHOB|nr:glycosyltransferase family A protein [Roseovarius albus]SLN54389.1 N-glycosyltransferase [Roseovarius albus]
MSKSSKIGVVVIGRNEGERLLRCLASIPDWIKHVVYVDSGSTDESCASALATGATVHELDLSKPFTAARARNEGLETLLSDAALDYVQFIDGDCEFRDGWIEAAVTFLQDHPEVAVACGRRRERYPERSVFNRLCDWEWDTPVGKAQACGGDAMMRVDALQQVGGYNPSLIAGEEPELCVRFRAKGWSIWRLNHEMTWHDVAMTRLGQWWKRNRRAGYAYAEGADMHGAPPERHGVREVRRALLWTMFPIAVILISLLFNPLLLLALLVFPAQVMRLTKRDQRTGREAFERACFLTFAKWPEAHGIIEYKLRKLFGRRRQIIEYK